MKHAFAIALTLVTIGVVAACATNDSMVIGADCDGGFCTALPPPSFEAPDTGPPKRSLTNYCPSNKCPTGFTTCANSKFLCDVDFRTDPLNCGGCGQACPGQTNSGSFVCESGQCKLQCALGYADCDGIVENGCEVQLGRDPDNCRACGDKCEDGLPCIYSENEPPRCGCPDPFSFCPPTETRPPQCAKLDSADDNCGTCGTTCDRAGAPGSPPPPANSYYGCIEGKCDRPKCNPNWADCNKDPADGCETPLTTHGNCTACGDDCRARGQSCVYTIFQGAACRCPPGTNFCGSTDFEPYFGSCADFSNDRFNCGGCGRICQGLGGKSTAYCESGICKLECLGRWADCDGNLENNCEVDIHSDPSNCGGCGVKCDLAAGQACAGGRCVVEPCKGEQSR